TRDCMAYPAPMRRITFLLVLIIAGASAWRAVPGWTAEPDVTFTHDVAPILYAKCVACHRAGEVAPMELLTYEQARPWARAIKEKVLLRQMPPWFADPKYGTFSNDPTLTAREIDTITKWVDGGAPRGDSKDM